MISLVNCPAIPFSKFTWDKSILIGSSLLLDTNVGFVRSEIVDVMVDVVVIFEIVVVSSLLGISSRTLLGLVVVVISFFSIRQDM